MLIKSLTKVDKLTQRVEGLYNQRHADELRHEREQARLKEIRAADDVTKTDFWCKRHGDTTGLAYKVVFKSFGEWCAYYESFDKGFPKELTACCKRLRRYITDKHWDSYYTDSHKLELERRQAIENGDLLQPGDYGFTTKYGDPNKKKWAKMEAEERASFKKKIILHG